MHIHLYGTLVPTKVPVLGHLKKTKAYHLALGHHEDSSEEIKFNSDEENIGFANKGANSVVALVEIVINSRMMEGKNLSSEHIVFRPLITDNPITPSL